MKLLPETGRRALKRGIFYFGTENLHSFFEESTAMRYDWINDDSEPDKRERILNTINEFCKMSESPEKSSLTIVQLVKNFYVLGVRRESLPLSVQDSLSHSFSNLSPETVEKMKRL
jgi:hypothetical protein